MVYVLDERGVSFEYMKYFLIAGEASGDLHASNLMEALRERDPQATFVGLGGDKMRAAGCKLYVDYRKMAYMGFVAVFLNIGKVFRNLYLAKQALEAERPDVLVLVDYPSFNLKIAKYCKEHLPQTRIIYYIPPKIWAWKRWRVHNIAKLSDKILGIFPFEPAFYAKYGYKCRYVGNPTADSIRSWRLEAKGVKREARDQRIIAILPGSRKGEIKKCLPTMLAAARNVAGEEYQIVVTAAPGIDDSFYAKYLHGEELTRDTYGLLDIARAAVVNSGTATLETALIGCPQTAVYHVAGSKYLEKWLKPIMFKIKYFTLVNIIPNKEVIRELVASRFTQENVEEELYQLLVDQKYRDQLKHDYQQIWHILGMKNAAQQAANEIISL
jgi:lipid-A-disaccharide synthase